MNLYEIRLFTHPIVFLFYLYPKIHIFPSSENTFLFKAKAVGGIIVKPVETSNFCMDLLEIIYCLNQQLKIYIKVAD